MAEPLTPEAIYREALEQIAESSCEASTWASEEPPVRDRCLDPEFVEGEPEGRCAPCGAANALRLATLDAARAAAPSVEPMVALPPADPRLIGTEYRPLVSSPAPVVPGTFSPEPAAPPAPDRAAGLREELDRYERWGVIAVLYGVMLILITVVLLTGKGS